MNNSLEVFDLHYDRSVAGPCLMHPEPDPSKHLFMHYVGDLVHYIKTQAREQPDGIGVSVVSCQKLPLPGGKE